MEKQVRWFIWIFKLYDVELPLFFCDKSHVKNWITNQTNEKKTRRVRGYDEDEDEQVFVWREKRPPSMVRKATFFGKFIIKKKSWTFHSSSIL